MGKSEKPTVLLVEGDDGLRRILAASLEAIDVHVLQAVDVKRGWEMLIMSSPDVLVIERDFPFGNNGKLIDAYREHTHNPVVVTTTHRLDDIWRESYQPDATLYKPFDTRLLCKVITSLLRGPEEARANSHNRRMAR